jgi:hypothetical protein
MEACKAGVLNRRAKNFKAYQQKSQEMKLVNSKKNELLINKEQFVFKITYHVRFERSEA